MSTAYVETDYAWVRLHAERLRVYSPKDDDPSDDLLQEIPLLNLERLCLREHVQITTEALCALLRRGIPVHYLDWKGDCLGATLPPPREESATRLRQYERVRDPAFVLQQASLLIEAKIRNQLRLLQRLNANHQKASASDIGELSRLAAVAAKPSDLSSLLGIEGAAASLHYRLWACFLPPEFPFERRSTRPPANAVNACISFAATLLYHDFVAVLHLRGLDPGLGFLHATQDGRWSLALDLMEPFRPALCDALTLRLLSHRIIQPDEFEPHNGGTYLAESGRRDLIAHYERRLDRSFFSEPIGHRTTLRQAFVDQAVNLKAAIKGEGEFKPFRLN